MRHVAAHATPRSVGTPNRKKPSSPPPVAHEASWTTSTTPLLIVHLPPISVSDERTRTLDRDSGKHPQITAVQLGAKCVKLSTRKEWRGCKEEGSKVIIVHGRRKPRRHDPACRKQPFRALDPSACDYSGGCEPRAAHADEAVTASSRSELPKRRAFRARGIRMAN